MLGGLPKQSEVAAFPLAKHDIGANYHDRRYFFQRSPGILSNHESLNENTSSTRFDQIEYLIDDHSEHAVNAVSVP